MIVTTTDPITGTEVINPETHPFLIEGEGDYALKIHFESEATKKAYLEHEAALTEDDLFSDFD